MAIAKVSGNSPYREHSGIVFLVGFMGTGKSYWGKKWAQLSGVPFYDLDAVIEKDQDRSITAIFENEGEDHFRKIETAVLHSMAATANCIIACGGGTPCFYDNMQWMNEHGTTVYIAASPQYILTRVKAEKDKRPLISKLNEAELLFFIEQKLKERVFFYNQAKIILPVADLNANSLSAINI